MCNGTHCIQVYFLMAQTASRAQRVQKWGNYETTTMVFVYYTYEPLINLYNLDSAYPIRSEATGGHLGPPPVDMTTSRLIVLVKCTVLSYITFHNVSDFIGQAHKIIPQKALSPWLTSCVPLAGSWLTRVIASSYKPAMNVLSNIII